MNAPFNLLLRNSLSNLSTASFEMRNYDSLPYPIASDANEKNYPERSDRVD
jgi:hypothetical protein